MDLGSGDEFVVDDIGPSPSHDNKAVAMYAVAVRENGLINGAPLGVLGLVFDWEQQGTITVRDEPPLSPEEWPRSRCLLLDSKMRVIASSDGQGLYEPYQIQTGSEKRGSYYLPNGDIVAFARTIGHETYDGLGWYGVIHQKMGDDDQ